jgi:hypothetical protein
MRFLRKSNSVFRQQFSKPAATRQPVFLAPGIAFSFLCQAEPGFRRENLMIKNRKFEVLKRVEPMF